MRKNDSLTFLTTFTTLIAIILILAGCAAMQNPDGGPKDTTPPKVLKLTPENLTTNFQAKKISIQFDEYVKLNNEFKEFSISPETEKIPELRVKGKSLEITLPDSLEKNTTYTLNFGKSIVDLNESNELKNYSYVFSTGPTLDSLSIAGNVTNALTGDPEIEALVFALPLKKDSLFGVKTPSIFTLTDSSGNFKLNNLKKDQYKIYALKEKGGDKIYQQISDEIGFYNKIIDLQQNVDSIHLQVFKEIAQNFRILDKKINQDGSIFISFNKGLKNPEIEISNPTLDKSKQFLFSKNKDSVSIWLTDLSFDSVKVAIKDEGKNLETVNLTRGKRDTYTRNLTFNDNLSGGVLNPFNDFQLTFNLPLKQIDKTKITLLEDSIPRNFELIKDSTNLLKYNIKYKWRAKEKYILLVKEAATTAIFETKNKEIIRNFAIDDPNNYGSLALTIEIPDSTKSYVLEIIDNDKKLLKSFPINASTTINLNNIRQGIYYARIAYDTNKNGIWDTGNVIEGLQPEAIYIEPKELSIRANWDRKEIIKIPLVAPLQIIKKNSVPKENSNNTKPNGLNRSGLIRN